MHVSGSLDHDLAQAQGIVEEAAWHAAPDVSDESIAKPAGAHQPGIACFCVLRQK